MSSGSSKSNFFPNLRLKHRKWGFLFSFGLVFCFSAFLRAAIKSLDTRSLPGIPDDRARAGCAILCFTLSLKKSCFFFLMGWLEWYHHTSNPICALSVSRKICLPYQIYLGHPEVTQQQCTNILRGRRYQEVNDYSECHKSTITTTGWKTKPDSFKLKYSTNYLMTARETAGTGWLGSL